MKSSIVTVESEIVTGPNPKDWDLAKKFTRGAEQFERCKVACQLLAGLELIGLYKKYGIKRGGDRRSNPNHLGLKWEDLVKKQLGISDETARNWMGMAKAAAPRLKKIGGFKDLPLLELAPHAWPENQQQLLEKAVHKITDGKTQLEFMFELGIAKKPHGHRLVDGSLDRKYHSTRADGSPRAERRSQVELKQEEVREEWDNEMEERLWCWLREEKYLYLDDKRLETLDGILIDLKTKVTALKKERGMK